MKIIIENPWGQDINTLIHLAFSPVRSKLTYGQESYFSAPQSCLSKLQSLDSKAIKLALEIPVHANTLGAHKEAGILPPDEIHKLTAAKYIIRGPSVANHANAEAELGSDNLPFFLLQK